ncbi:hypothetical protein KDA12_06195 [Proteus mirabilis]|nr:hypothetical protein [Proteus mirabilis]ELA7761794.1 hypothetical protein [Proteus mirabilis]HBC5786074.1 hypothetical protein [Proteus mirabilis]HEI8911361.1 hypothetical protein [Proteus mirabilis]
MNYSIEGTDLLSKRMVALSGLLITLSNIGLSPFIAVPIGILLVYILRK